MYRKNDGKNSSIRRPDIQQFCGAMSHKGVTKGVFVTTSKFTSETKVFAQELTQQKIVLIADSLLAQLMIEYDLGVSTERVYKIKGIDNDYFNPGD